MSASIKGDVQVFIYHITCQVDFPLGLLSPVKLHSSGIKREFWQNEISLAELIFGHSLERI